MLTRARKLIESPNTAIPHIRSRLGESRVLLSRGYPLEAALRSARLAGVDWQLPYLRMKSSDGTLIRSFHGSRMELSVDDRGMVRDLLVRGSREARSVEVFKRELRALHDEAEPPVVCLDVGANVGYFSLMQANLLADDARIFAIEPAPENVASLERNVELNDYGSIEIVRGALSDAPGEVELTLHSRSNLHSVNGISGTSGDGRTITVPAWSGDGFVREHGYRPSDVGVVRMDVEGYEATIFDGMRAVLSAPGPRLLGIEIHPRTLTSGDPGAFVGQLEDWGYELVFGYWDRPNRDDVDEVFETWDEIARSDRNGIEVVAKKRADPTGVCGRRQA